MAKLAPVKNYRGVIRRACSNCQYWKEDYKTGPGWWKCERPQGPFGDWFANAPDFHVCDGHKWPTGE